MSREQELLRLTQTLWKRNNNLYAALQWIGGVMLSRGRHDIVKKLEDIVNGKATP